MRVSRAVLALTMGVAVLVAACGRPSVTIAPSVPAVSHSPVPGVGAVIPTDDGSEKFDVFGEEGSTALATATSIAPADLQAVLSANGKTTDDFSYAIATGSAGTTVAAFQIQGLTASHFSSLIPEANTATVKHVTLGGKDVLASEAANIGAWVYMKDDMIFVITGTKDAAAAMLKKLP